MLFSARPRWCAPQQASMATMHDGSLVANARMLSRRARLRMMTRPVPSSPTRLQGFLPKSTPRTADCMGVTPPRPGQLNTAGERGGPFHNHVSIDRAHGFVRRFTVTDAATYDGGALTTPVHHAHT